MGSEMTTGNEETSRDLSELNEEERASIFAAANAPKDRHGNARARRVTVPTKFIVWSIVAVLLLGLGGGVAQHFVETYGKIAAGLAHQGLFPMARRYATALPALMDQKDRFESEMAAARQQLDEKHAFERG